MLWFAAMPSPASEPHKQVLHRVDMQVAGSSCATCLIRLEKKLKAEKGVLKVVVSIFKPFKSAVIYDETQTNWQTINKVLEGEKVTAADFKDTPINDVPLVLEPK
jgi:copper chaperone CopZ